MSAWYTENREVKTSRSSDQCLVDDVHPLDGKPTMIQKSTGN